MVKYISCGILLIVYVVLIRVVDKIFKEIGKKSDGIHIRYIKSTIKVLITIVCVYSIMQGFSLTKDLGKTILTSSSLIIALITYSAQDSIANIVSGLALSITKPFGVGDKISLRVSGNSVAYVSGRVETMTISYVKIKEYNGDIDTIPNKVVSQSIIVNTDVTEMVRYQDTVTVGYNSDLEKVEEIIRGVLYENEFTINNKDNTMIEIMLESSGIAFRYSVVSEDINISYSARSSVAKEILNKFTAEGIVIPYQTINVLKGE